MTEDAGIAVGGKFNADVLLALGGVTQQLKYMRQENHEAQRQAQYARLKNYIPLTETVTLDASGKGVMNFGTPMLGRQWTVRQLAVAVQGDELFNPAAAFIAGWYIGVNVPGDSTNFTSQWRLTQYSPPAINTFTSDIHQARMGETLFALITAGTAGNVIVGNAIVLDEPMKVGIPTAVQG